MDETTKARALELSTAGVPQRAAAAELGISRASYRRAIAAPGGDSRQATPSSNGALRREPPPPVDLEDDDGADLEPEDDDGKLPDRAALFAAVLVVVVILAAFLWPWLSDWREDRAAGRSVMPGIALMNR
jgi:hypothetical protein